MSHGKRVDAGPMVVGVPDNVHEMRKSRKEAEELFAAAEAAGDVKIIHA